MTTLQHTTRLVVTNQPWHYLTIQVVFDNMSTKSTPSIDVIQFRTFIARCNQQWYGLVGSGMPIDILGYDTTTYRGIIRVATADVSALWSAIAMATPHTVEGKTCILRIINVSASLVALACSSRSLE